MNDVLRLHAVNPATTQTADHRDLPARMGHHGARRYGAERTGLQQVEGGTKGETQQLDLVEGLVVGSLPQDGDGVFGRLLLKEGQGAVAFAHGRRMVDDALPCDTNLKQFVLNDQATGGGPPPGP